MMQDTKIINVKQGFFYHVILELFEEDSTFSESKIEVKTGYVCEHAGIEKDTSINQDYKKALEIIESDEESLANEEPLAKKLFKKLKTQVHENIQGKIPGDNDSIQEQEKMKLIIIVACTLVGLYFCLYYIQKKKRRSFEPHGFQPSVVTPTQIFRPISVKLYLIVPAHETIRFSSGTKIEAAKLKQLIDASSYFFCNTIIDNNKLSLETPSGPIAENSYREMYIKIDITDGKDMIGAKTRYSLKENLKDTARCIIEEIAYLKSLSGLENFVRV
ncbi:hypothetical protein PN441_01280 [Spirulina major CS-329]|nr:hypothetical protein [Spirulina major CS-329]